MERKLAAILAADVAGYSRLMSEDEETTLRHLNACRQVIDRLIEDHNGRVFGSAGDSVVAEFASPVEAVRCAVETQREIDKRGADQPEDRRMRFRVGINLGDVMVDGDDVYGDAVNVAARLEGLAEPGGIWVSAAVFNHVKKKVDLGFEDLGEHQVKNIAEPIQVYRVGLPQGEPSGLTRATTQPWGRRVLAAAAVAVAMLGGIAAWKLFVSPSPPPEQAGFEADAVLALPSGPSIAVLPFENLSGDPEQDYFSDGVTEEIITVLSRFRPLYVLARRMTSQYRGKAVDIKQVGRDLKIDYALEGSIRRASDRVRVTAQLLDAASGTQLWAESYDKALTPTNLFEVQDAIASKIAATVASAGSGVLSNVSLQKARGKAPRNLASYECVLQAYQPMSRAKFRDRAECLQRSVELDPDYSDAWAGLAVIYTREYWHGWRLPESGSYDPRKRALTAALKAVELAPESASAHTSLARAYYAAGQIDRFAIEAEQTLSLNPDDPYALGLFGLFFCYTGSWEKGLALVNKAFSLVPKSYRKIWYWCPAKDHFHKKEFAQALDYFKRSDFGSWWNHLQFAYTYGQLGERESAAAAVDRLLELKPAFGIEDAVAAYRKFHFQESYIDLMTDGLRKAGLSEKGKPEHPD